VVLPCCVSEQTKKGFHLRVALLSGCCRKAAPFGWGFARASRRSKLLRIEWFSCEKREEFSEATKGGSEGGC
jgi:hypothetical protein